MLWSPSSFEHGGDQAIALLLVKRFNPPTRHHEPIGIIPLVQTPPLPGTCLVSDSPQDLIRGLLNINPKTRLTARQALEHSWLRQEGGDLVRNDLSSTLERLKVFNGKRKMRAAIHTVRT